MPSLSRGSTTLALLSTLSSLLLPQASAASIGLPSEIVDFVPSCATSCLSTFIDANFPSGVCGSKPSFECLCAHTGTSGFTVGEGALACIASEDSVGQCTGTDVSLTASQKAYSMCSGQASAAPETHATLVATLVIPNQPTKTVTMTAVNTNTNTGKTTNSQTTSSTTTLFFLTSPLPTRTSTTHKTTSTTPLTDSDSVLLTAPPRSDTTVATHPPTATTKSASDTSSAQTGSTSEQAQPKNKTNSLSVGQIVGISVGTAAALILAIALSIYLSIVRRRRLALVPRLTGDGYKGYNGDRDSDEEGFRQRFRPRTGHELQISVPVNLQAPMQASSNKGPSWQEKYGPSRTAPRGAPNSNFNPNPNFNSTTPQPENRMDAPLPAPPTILITRPTLERAGATVAPEARPARNLTPRTINGQPNGSPRGGMNDSPPRAAGTLAAQNAAQMQNSVPPSLAIGRPTQTATPNSNTTTYANTNTYNAVSRPTPYPSYYGIPPDDARPSFGSPQRPKDPVPVSVPVPPVPARSAQRLSQPQIRTVRPEGALPSVFQPPLNNRDSIVTEFAEDGEDDFSPRVTDGGRYPSRQFSSTSSVQEAPRQDVPRQEAPRQQFVAQGQRYPAGSHTHQQTQIQPSQNQSSPRQQRQPLPQFQIQPQHEPQLRPQHQPQPRTPSPRTDNGNGFNNSPQPFMSPSLVPRPLDLGSRPAVNQSPPRNDGPITLNMPDGAGSNVSRMAKLRLRDERAFNLRLNGDRRSPRPRQNAGWRRMDDGPEY